MHNVMDEINAEYSLSQERADALVEEMSRIFDEYDIPYQKATLYNLLNDWAKAKGRLINTLSNHPNWNPEKFQIQFTNDYQRGLDLDQIKSFFAWMNRQIAEANKKELNNMKPFGYTETAEIIDRLDKILHLLDLSMVRNHKLTVDGRTNEEWQKEYSHFIAYRADHFSNVDNIYVDGAGWMDIDEATRDKITTLNKVRESLLNYFERNMEMENIHLCTEELKEIFDVYYPGIARIGQKISKILCKIGKTYGLDKIKDMRTVNFTTNDGRYVTREKDFGWNYQYTQMGDAINPYTIERHTLISVNPIDYLTMSFGHEWHSCMDISKGQRYEGGYSGEYCAGTISYMRDTDSLIFYTVDRNYNGNYFELEDKMQRAVMGVGGDKIYVGRVYPDGRDKGDTGYATQFRTVIQKVIADCLGVNNLWVTKKGSSETSNQIHNCGGRAYTDWTCCGDSAISFLKIDDEVNDTDKINLNAPAKCVCCGCILDDSENIACDECRDEKTCDHCGCVICHDDDYIHTADGNTYCSEDCAERGGYVFCVDDEEWHHTDSDIVYDDYEGCYYYNDCDAVYTNYGTYANPENAEADGLRYCENSGEWEREDDTAEDALTGDYIYIHDSDVVKTVDGNFYADSYNAEQDGYVLNDDCEWVKADEIQEEAV